MCVNRRQTRGTQTFRASALVVFWAILTLLVPMTALAAGGGPGGGSGGSGGAGGNSGGSNGSNGSNGNSSGNVLVRLKAGVGVQAIAHDYNANVLDQVTGTGLYSLSVPGRTNAAAFVKQLSSDVRVVYAEIDVPIVAPETFEGNPIHFAIDRTSIAGGYIAQNAYAQAAGGRPVPVTDSGIALPVTGNIVGSGVVVAVLDTGVTFDHPALAGHLLAGYNALQPDALPWDIPDGVTNAAAGHGTMVTGIIVRLAPGATILPVRVLNADGTGSMLNIAKGVHYAVTHGARVLNMSFGASALTNVMKDALDEAEAAGVVIVAAAGNDGANKVQYPASGRGAIAVGAVDDNYTKAAYSSYGSFVRVMAPGSEIRSTYWDGGYATWSGTSFATPFVSAEAALVLSVNPAADVRHVIRASAHSIDALNPAYRGWLGDGVIDLVGAIQNAFNR